MYGYNASPSYPGVISDGLLPGGMVMQGLMAANRVQAQDNVRATINLSEARLDSAGRLFISRTDDSLLSIEVDLAAGSAGEEIAMFDSNNVAVWRVDADGKELLAKGLGEWGVTPVNARPIISGVLTSATLAQLTNVVTQILNALDAKGSVSKATT